MKKIKLLYLVLLLFTCICLFSNKTNATGDSIVLTPTTLGLTTGYASAGKTVGGMEFYYQRLMKSTSNGDSIQGNSNSGGSFIYNTTSLGAIEKIEIDFYTFSENIEVYYSNSKITDTSELTNLTGVNYDDRSVFNFPASNNLYFRLRWSSGAVYIDSISIYYETTKISVNFKDQDGSPIDSIDTRQINLGSTLGTLQNAPEKTGFRFDGWYDHQTAGNKVLATTPITQTTTLYARYIKTYTVSFNTQGGNTIEDSIVDTGAAVSKPTDPTKASYKFLGWYRTGEVETYNFSTPVTADLTLNAKWIRQSIVDFQEMTTSESMMFNYTKDDSAVGTETYTFNTAGKSGAIDASSIGLDNTALTLTPYKNDPTLSPEFANNFIKLYRDTSGNPREGNSIIFSSPNADIKSIKIYLDTLANYSISGSPTITTVENETNYYLLTYNTPVKEVEIKNTSNSQGFVGGEGYVQTTTGNVVYTLTNNSTAIRFGTVITKEMYDDLTSSGTSVQFGVEVEGESFNITPVRVENANASEYSETGNFYQFALVLQNIPNTELNIAVTAKVFVNIDGTIYYMKEKEHSVVTLADVYSKDSNLSEYKELFEYIVSLGGQ